MGANTQTPGSLQSGVSTPNSQIVSQLSGSSGLPMKECVFMPVSQSFPLSVISTTLPWVGCANGYLGTSGSTLPWMPNGDGLIVTPGLYMWRIRMWNQTAPAAGLKMQFGINNILGLAWNYGVSVDDIVAYSSYRMSWLIPASYGPGEPLAAPTLLYSLSATDATGVLKYDMGVTKLR